ncbi:MAG: PIN domain-containing protein [Alphaproteobacteria bacterium]|nr:MAG: PIN domain-containing protein [Alphaproteobacteria bacterium]
MGSSVSPKVYLDTNVFLAAYESAGARSDHAFWIFSAIESGDIQGVTSEITLAELLPGPVEEGNDDLADAYKRILSDGPNMEVLPVTRETLIETAVLRAGRPGLKLPDAIHCATALRAACTAMVTDDRRIPKNLGVRIVPFGPHVLDHVRGAIP